MEKFLTELFFFVLAIGFTSAELQRCNKQSQCKETECCSKRFMRNEAYCVPYRKIGQMCLVEPRMVNGTYSINCPCEEGLECRKPEFFNDLGQVIYSENPECILKGTDQLPMEFYIRRRNYYRFNNGYGSFPRRYPSEVEYVDYGSRANSEAESGNGFVSNGLVPNYETIYRRR